MDYETRQLIKKQFYDILKEYNFDVNNIEYVSVLEVEDPRSVSNRYVVCVQFNERKIQVSIDCYDWNDKEGIVEYSDPHFLH